MTTQALPPAQLTCIFKRSYSSIRTQTLRLLGYYPKSKASGRKPKLLQHRDEIKRLYEEVGWPIPKIARKYDATPDGMRVFLSLIKARKKCLPAPTFDPFALQVPV
jgi:hypothetical protein